MRAIEIRETGAPQVLRLVERPTPAPKPGEILVRNEAIGVNLFDTYQRSGLYKTPLPTILGTEGAGVVEALGEGVTRFTPGDRVAYAAGSPGAYAEARTVPAARAARLPGGMDASIAAAALLKGMMAQALLTRCYAVARGDVILIHAAAGGVGLILSQWAKSLGATVIGTVGSAEKADLARRYGCDHVLRYEDFAARVRALTEGKGASVVYDGVGAATFEGSLTALARRGILVGYGNASGPAPSIDPMRLMRGGSLSYMRMSLADFIATEAEFDATAGAVFDMIAAGSIKIRIGQKWPLHEAAAAHQALEARVTTGSTILVV